MFITVSLNAYSNIVIIEGIVLNAETSEPVANAAVVIPDFGYYVTTKQDGSFSLEINLNKPFRIKITHIAFQEKLIDINPKSDNIKKLIIYLIPKTINLAPVVITDKNSVSIYDEIKDYSNILRGKELQRNLSQTLAATLKNETGLSVRSMGPAPSRPVFRGLGQDRILLTEDGIKSIDLSATSPDHAVTIEPFTAERIEVLRGPKILTKSSSSVGGVVNIIKDEIPTQIHNTYHITLGGYAETVNKGYLGSIQSEVPIKPFALKIELSKRNTSDLRTPGGLLQNSSSENLNASAGLSFIDDFGYFGSSYSTYDLKYGIPGGFVGAHPKGVNIDITKRQLHFHSKINLKDDSEFLQISYKNIYYRHKEFEYSGRIGSEFRIITNLVDVDLNHSKLLGFDEGIFGLSLEHRDFEIGGFVFTPQTNSINLSSFVYEEVNIGKLNLNFGIRYSFDLIKPNVENPNSKIGHIRKRNFNNLSASTSLIYQLSDKVFMGVNLSKSSRVPTTEELFSEGPHLAAYSYEVGNPDLKSESGIASELFVYHKFERLNFNLNFFYNNFSSFIIPRNSGEINYQTFLPIYKTFGVAAVLYGFDGSMNWNFYDNLFLTNSINFTKGIFRENSKPLPQIPPFKGITGVQYKVEDLSIGINCEWAFRQNDVDEFEQPTSGYVIFNTFTQYLFYVKESVNLISISIDNIFNSSYRNHLSRIKSVLPEAGFNIRLIYKLIL
ncbi:MAG: TonB-dependent receptor [Ignavibacterium sp.]|uniref:TonB-dependent receptor n=1 Tax=Ignavibacterium sp. TaxID=2651167 RepID=UPI00404AAB8D